MAQPYLERLAQMVERLELPPTSSVTLDARHFFSGAALYADGKICALLTPAAFAVKLPAAMRRTLIEAGQGAEFRVFASGPIKRDYVALSDSILGDDEALRNLVGASVAYVAGRPGPNALAADIS